jgi:hypothetical protein
MFVTKLEVGKVYKYGTSEIYIVHIKENPPKKNRDGVWAPQPKSITGVDLGRPWDSSTVKLNSSSTKLGEEVEKPFNREEWGIKTLYNILYNECRFIYNHVGRRIQGREEEVKAIETLYKDVVSQCDRAVRNLDKYKKLLARKNSLCRLVLRNKSNSRGASQRAVRFDYKVREKLPIGTECPPPEDWEVPEALLTACNRMARNDVQYKNHLNLTIDEFTKMNLGRVQFDYCTDYPQSIGAINSHRYGVSTLEWLGADSESSYYIRTIEGDEYFSNASIKDGKHYIKPYGWPELYKGRLQTLPEVRALRGRKNGKGLTYIRWLSTNPEYLVPFCGHAPAGCSVAVALNCPACAKSRYEYWLKG